MSPRPRKLITRALGWANRHRVLATAGVALTIGGVVACSSTNTYPADIFAEMHYQKSYRSLEPSRPLPPEGIVPITGRAPMYSFDEMAELANPVPDSPEVQAHGQQLFRVNCQTCHGPQGLGNGPISGYFQAAVQRPPANLTDPRLVEAADGYLAGVITHGFGLMPPFGDLLTGDDIWAIVHYIRTLQTESQ